MGKPQRREKIRKQRKDLQKQAARPFSRQKLVRSSAFKVRRILDLIRGLPAEEALDVLVNLPHRAAREVRKVLLTAMANAENNCGMDREALVVSRAYADEAFTIPRIQARAMGRAFRIRKRLCHVTIWVGAED